MRLLTVQMGQNLKSTQLLIVRTGLKTFWVPMYISVPGRYKGETPARFAQMPTMNRSEIVGRSMENEIIELHLDSNNGYPPVGGI